MKICEDIATANESDINEVHEKLINIWLPGAEQSITYSDPNATLDFGDMVESSDNAEKDLIIAIPYLDPTISRLVFSCVNITIFRIVHILRARDPQVTSKILSRKLDEVV